MRKKRVCFKNFIFKLIYETIKSSTEHPSKSLSIASAYALLKWNWKTASWKKKHIYTHTLFDVNEIWIVRIFKPQTTTSAFVGFCADNNFWYGKREVKMKFYDLVITFILREQSNFSLLMLNIILRAEKIRLKIQNSHMICI